MAPFVVILLIGNIFVYYGLSRQNADIKKDISELKDGLKKQQENTKNLQNLVTFNWKEYKNDKFGFSFKYPKYANVCDNTMDYNEKINATVKTEKAELNLYIGAGGNPEFCGTSAIPPIFVTIEKNINNYKTAEEAFYKEFPDINKSLNNQFDHLNIAKADAYGGKIAYKLDNSRFTRENGYGIIILKNDYIIKFSDTVYDEIFDNKEIGNKSLFDATISTFYSY